MGLVGFQVMSMVTPECVWGKAALKGEVCVFKHELFSSLRRLGSILRIPSVHA